jgi:2-dehydro-3-deoxygalactonokinase
MNGMATSAGLIAVDWGTTRLRAYLLAADGTVLDRRATDEGVMNIPAGGFPDTLQRVCHDWLAATPALRVVMAGMVGSRNGWLEAPYAPCPASLRDLAGKTVTVTRQDGGVAEIIPGVSGIFDGAADVMRGEETLIAGLDLEDGLVCLPGTHSKWALVRGSRLERFATFMTGEIFATLSEHSILGRLAAEPRNEEGFGLGLDAAKRPGGTLHRVFAARADVLLNRLPATHVLPYLSGLLVADEIRNAIAVFGGWNSIALVASEPQAGLYRQALEKQGFIVSGHAPEDALIRGLARLGALG